MDYSKCILFKELSEQEAQGYLIESGATVLELQKGEYVFHQGDEPKYLYILEGGRVDICQDTVSGKRNLIARIENEGELFGEVYLFLERKGYDFYAMTSEFAKIIRIPKNYFLDDKTQMSHSHLRTAMLKILAHKAYYLNQKIRMMSVVTLRQKIARFLLDRLEDEKKVRVKMTREEWADFLGTTRPSLSRELGAMQDEGLIEIEGKMIYIYDKDVLESI
ncbi:MAG: Crp/Fnr family transcriptional regulator [Filifactor alocis]|nr:Crp/Fnr family transcriptional regulator [Filifactor alocis]